MGFLDWFLVILGIFVTNAVTLGGMVDTRTMFYFQISLCLLAILWWETASVWSPASSANSVQSVKTVVQLNESLYELYKPPGEVSPSMQVLFFHGLQFEPDYEKMHISTWESRDGSCVWPQTWLVREFPDAHVFSVSYNQLVKNSLQGEMQIGRIDLDLIGKNLLYDLMEANIGQVLHCPVTLVGHSFGGLVIKQLCLVADRFHLNSDTRSKKFLENIRGFFYYGAPPYGSLFTNKVAVHLLDGPLLEYVQMLSTDSEKINYRFNNLCRLYVTWHTEGLGESLPTKLGGLRSMFIVPDPKAIRDWQIFNLVEDADHFSICKPINVLSRSFRSLASLLHKLKDEANSRKQELAGTTKEVNFHEQDIPENFQYLPKKIVDIEHAIKDIKLRLRTNSSLGLVGMGGIGKTTLAKASFNILGPDYEYTCFIHDVKDIKGGMESSTMEMLDLMTRAILECLHHNGKKCNIANNNNLKLLRGKCLFLVLDDVSTKFHLEVVFILQNDIKIDQGSRFLITSRDSKLLDILDEIYKIPFLDMVNARGLFISLALPSEREFGPILERYIDNVVKKCNGLPLALQVLGKYLYKKPKGVWEQAMDNLDKTNDKTRTTLKLSFDHLATLEQEMFLDAATIFNGWPLGLAKVAWSSTMKGRVHLFWQHLMDLSLVNEREPENSKEVHVHVHEQLQILGKEIASTFGENGKCTRLWEEPAWEYPKKWNFIEDDIEDIVALRANCGTPIDMMSVDERESRPIWVSTCIQGKKLSTLQKLRYLSIFGSVDIDQGGREPFSATVVFLEWYYTNLTELPFDPLFIRQLTVLRLSHWKKLKSLPTSFGLCSSLRILEVLEAECLESLPDLFGHLWCLEELTLQSCPRLKRLPVAFGDLRGLKSLQITECGLRMLPDSFGKLWELDTLTINQCHSLNSLPESFGHLSRLRHLHIKECYDLQCLPDSFGFLSGLEALTIDQCHSLNSLPESFGELSRLQLLHIKGCYDLKYLPELFGELLGLEDMRLEECYALITIPDSFGNLSRLKNLAIISCDCMHTLPNSIGQLEGLEYLELFYTPLKSIPDSIERLPSLKTLKLRWIENRQVYPVLPKRLANMITPKNYYRPIGWTFNVVNWQLTLNEDNVFEEQERSARMYLNSKQERSAPMYQNRRKEHITLLHGKMMDLVHLEDYQGALMHCQIVDADLECLNGWERGFYLEERGVLKRLTGDLGGALEDLTAALKAYLKSGGDDYESRKHRGYVRYLMGDIEGASNDAERAVEIMPERVLKPNYGYNVSKDGSRKLEFLGGHAVSYLGFDLQ